MSGKKKKKKAPEPDSGGADFMTLFTALSVILLAFFILLTTMAVIDDDKSRKALGSLRGSFGILPGGLVFDNEGQILEQHNTLIDEIVIIDRMLKDMRRILRSRDFDGGMVELDVGGAYPKLRIASGALYPNGGTEISPRSFPILDRLAAAADDMDRVLVIEGHTGSSPPPKDSRLPSNWELSTRRAVNVQRYLITAADVDPAHIEAEGVAEFRPRDGRKPKDEVVIVFRPRTPAGPGDAKEKKTDGP